MKTYRQSFQIKTKKSPEFVDITDRVIKIVKKSSIRNGQVLVFSRHTTAAIVVNENEPLLIEDMENFLTRLADPKVNYNHNDFSRRTVNMCAGECKNGHSHCQHLLLPVSETLPLIDSQIPFGKWQRVFLIELDHSREREIVVQVMGK